MFKDGELDFDFDAKPIVKLPKGLLLSQYNFYKKHPECLENSTLAKRARLRFLDQKPEM